MKAINVGSGRTSPLTPPTIDDGSPSACQSWADYEIAQTIINMRAGDYQLLQVEDSDVSLAETDFDALSQYLEGWVSSAIQAESEGTSIPDLDMSYIPDIISFTGLALTGQWGLVFTLFVKVGLKFLLTKVQSTLEGETDTESLIELIKDVAAHLDENRNVVGSRLSDLSNLKVEVNLNDDTAEMSLSSYNP